MPSINLFLLKNIVNNGLALGNNRIYYFINSSLLWTVS